MTKNDGYKARDVNATRGPRTHTIILNGEEQDFIFPARSYIDVPKAAAMKFALIEGFEVLDSNGQVISVKAGKPRSIPAMQLEPDQIIARFEELSDEALSERLRIANPRLVDSVFDRETMIAALIQIGAKENKDDEYSEVRMNDAAD